MAEVSSPNNFQQPANLQMSSQQLLQMQYANESKFNLPQPNLIQSRSTNQVYDNLRKHDNMSHQNQFAGQQQINDNSFFQNQQAQGFNNAPAFKRQMSNQAMFSAVQDSPLKKKASFPQKQQFQAFDMSKNFIPASAPAKLNVQKNVANEPLPMLDLTKCQHPNMLDAPATPATRCNTHSHVSSQGSYPNSDLEEAAFDTFIESPNKKLVRQGSIKYKQSPTIELEPFTPLSKKNSKLESGWKRKVKTELCRFWLKGQQCENLLKEQGCGFAHGQEELQKKKTLSRQYLTSVCKNFLDHPSKCTYGTRCIFQHPTHEIKERQNYTVMMEDNQRYTAMRLF